MKKFVLVSLLGLALAACDQPTGPGPDPGDLTPEPQFATTPLAHVVDQEQTESTTGFGAGIPLNLTIGQTFTPSVNKLSAFELGIMSNPGEFEVNIVHWATQTPLATFSAILPGIVHLPTPVDVIPGERYGLLLLTGPPWSIALHDNTANSPEAPPAHDHYPEGHFVYGGAEVWWADAVFRTYAPVDCSVQTEIPVAECEALVTLYHATDGAGWDDNKGWLSTNAPCSWHGVTCTSGSVSGLSLADNQLAGPIPPELGDLSNLEFLGLNINQLTGPIPPELGSLTSLWYFYLSDNQVTGPIPPELGNLTSLWYLFLDRNQLTGPIPPELGNLTSLRGLWLWDNQLTGPIPPELGNLANLRDLYLQYNQLTGAIPAELGGGSNLQRLVLGWNQLSGEIPTELGNLGNLQEMWLNSNQLSGGIPSQLGNLSELRYLVFNSNQLSGKIPSELGNLDNLELVYLFSNLLSGLVPLPVAQLGGVIQTVGGPAFCRIVPPGNEGLYMPDTQAYRDADQDLDGLICGLGFTATPDQLLEALLDEMSPWGTHDKVEDAIAGIESALAELQKVPADRQAAMGNLEGAAGDLEAALDEGVSEASEWLTNLTNVARMLAMEAIDEAVDAGGDEEEITEAQDYLAEGDSLRSEDKFKDAVAKYKDAVAKAEGSW